MVARRFLFRFCTAFALLIAIVSVELPANAATGNGPEPSLFGSVEWRSDDLAPFRKWLAALERTAVERRQAIETRCLPNWYRACPYEEWLGYLESLRQLDRQQQLEQVNWYTNRFSYVPDKTNWGVSDYWETPGEFLENDGDCEDYAIVKYMSLKELGWSDDDLRLVTVIDRHARRPHAVLVAFMDGRSWLLDNRESRVLDTRQVAHYRPVYSLNARSWWRHRPPN